jgi:hypothetical protein
MIVPSCSKSLFSAARFQYSAHALDGALQHVELMPEGKDVDFRGGSAAMPEKIAYKADRTAVGDNLLNVSHFQPHPSLQDAHFTRLE